MKQALIKISATKPIPDDENPNVMSDEKYRALVKLVGEHGCLQPVTLQHGTYEIIDGHHRIRACAEAGMTEIPAIIVDLPPELRKSLRIALNGVRGDLNLGRVKTIMQDLMIEGWSPPEISLNTGFSLLEIETLVQPVQPMPELGGAPTTAPGSPGATAEKPHTLELKFATKAELDLVKKKLRKASGSTKDLGLGLLAVLGEDKSHDTH